MYLLATIAAGLIRGIEKNKRKRQRSGARRQVESCQDDHIIKLKTGAKESYGGIVLLTCAELTDVSAIWEKRGGRSKR
eukprot:scaffold3054_cov115-Skeletonema_marinoi.AAC.4